MKQKFFIILFGVLALVLGFYLSTKKNLKRPEETLITPTPRAAAQKPPVVIIPEEPTGISFQKAPLPEAPSTLLSYSYLPITISFEDALSIATRFGFIEKPLKITSGSTTSYQWKNDTTVFTADIETESTRLSFSQPEGSFFSSSLVENATQGTLFLKTLFPERDGQCTIQLHQTTNGPFDGTTTTDVLTGHYYACFTPNNHPIFTSEFSIPFASLVTNKAGIIRELSLSSLFSIRESKELPILTPEEAIFHITNGEGLLISLSRETLSFFDSPPQFADVSITSYSFVYYPNSSTKTLDPYYVLEGTTISTDGEKLFVKYALPALTKD